ncbi:MAG: DUF6398 domain-containing protein [Balneolaceae bacterium]
MSKKAIKERQKKLLELTNSFCEQKLDENYKQLCEKLINKMGRKKEVPFKSGKLEIWAASVVHAIGTINFLFDKSFEPYVSVADINKYYDTNNSTVSQKSKRIRNLFNMGYFDPEFSTSHSSESNPFNNMVMVDGYIVPLGSLPEEYQKLVKEARAEGEDIQFFSDEQ